MNEDHILMKVEAVLASDPKTVFQTLFNFFKTINGMSEGDLLATYNAVKFIQATCAKNSVGYNQAQSLLNSLSRVASQRSPADQSLLHSVIMNYRD